jgi:hypothetical protein
MWISKDKEGEWKLWMYMDILDVAADPFRPEQIPAVGVGVHGSF